MAIKVSLINMKGGVGKSTLAANLAWHFAGYENWLKKVLVIDLDPQFNASQYLLGANKYKQSVIINREPTVWNIFEQYNPQMPVNLNNTIKNVITYQPGSKIDLIPSQLQLSYTLQNPANKYDLLARFIDSVEENYDLIIIDCSPTESMLTQAAYLASDYLLVPVRPEYLCSIGLPLLVESTRDFARRYPNSNLQIAGIVFNATDGYDPEEVTAKSEVRNLATAFGIPIFNEEISYSRSYPKGARENSPIFRTSYARYDRIQEFYNFSVSFAQKVGL